MTPKKKKVLVLCTGNSCRSQIAEGWLRHFGGDHLDVYSAGVETHGVNPVAVKVMNEAGIDISGHNSTHVDEYRDIDFNLVVTVCDSARERCPVFPTPAQKIHRNFTDPAKAEGTEEQKLDVFRQVRDEIRDFSRQLTETF